MIEAWGKFIVCVTVIAVAGPFLSRYGDIIAQRTGARAVRLGVTKSLENARRICRFLRMRPMEWNKPAIMAHQRLLVFQPACMAVHVRPRHVLRFRRDNGKVQRCPSNLWTGAQFHSGGSHRCIQLLRPRSGLSRRSRGIFGLGQNPARNRAHSRFRGTSLRDLLLGLYRAAPVHLLFSSGLAHGPVRFACLLRGERAQRDRTDYPRNMDSLSSFVSLRREPPGIALGFWIAV